MNRNENDLEHTAQLALIAWYIIDSNKLDLDLDKVIKYALAHDLVEVYAGDTYIYGNDTKAQESKIEREELTLNKIKLEFHEFSELLDIIEAYELRESAEAKFIYALDKLIPVLNIYLDEGKSWHRDNINLQQIRQHKDTKIAESEDVNIY